MRTALRRTIAQWSKESPARMAATVRMISERLIKKRFRSSVALFIFV